jgi:hypothetical protein
MHAKPLTDLFKNEKKSKTFTIFFHVSQQDISCVPLQEAPAGGIVFWQSKSSYLFEMLHCSPYLENPTTLLSDNYRNYLFRHTKSAV